MIINKSNGIFITATGTDVGKTFISTLLIKALKEKNINVGYYKPALSGVENINGQDIAIDANYVCSNLDINIDPNSVVSYIYKTAVSPHLASKIEGNSINIDTILADFEKHKKTYDYLVVEGCGGIICPLNLDNKKLMLTDVIKALNLDIIIVSSAALGTINSTLLTIEYAKSLGLNIKGIILNRYDNNNFLHLDNKKSLEALTDAPIIAYVEENGDKLNFF